MLNSIGNIEYYNTKKPHQGIYINIPAKLYKETA
jgi:hypothetical protein